MPDISNIDSEKILSAVGQLDGVVDRMNGCVGKFADAIEALDKGWVSEVKSTFMSSYQRDWEAMQEMLSQLREINTTLREAASDFDKTESELQSGANALR
ncbi:MAG: WXG100 family type VII secretion target [Defluviitaleaceae bacterium]|nr:WXG100 family type VII secretion target [Defluviitaleaceae bacterium]